MSDMTSGTLLDTTVAYIKDQMQRQGITVPVLSDLTGVPKDTVNNILYHRSKNPGYEAVAALVYALGGSIDALAGHGLPAIPEEERQQDPALLVSHVERGWALALASALEAMRAERRAKRVLYITLLAVFAVIITILIVDASNGSIGFIRYQQIGFLHRYAVLRT